MDSLAEWLTSTEKKLGFGGRRQKKKLGFGGHKVDLGAELSCSFSWEFFPYGKKIPIWELVSRFSPQIRNIYVPWE